MKRFAILLNSEIKNDARVLKTISSLSKNNRVDLYYLNGDEKEDAILFNDNVNLFSINQKNTFKEYFLRHTWFYLEFNYFSKHVLNTKKNYDYVWANDLPTLYPAYKIAKKLNAKLVYDSHEIYIETINQFFTLKANSFKKLIFSILISLMKTIGLKFEKKLMPKVDFFITVNESILNYFKLNYTITKGTFLLNTPYLNKNNFKLNVDYYKMFNWASESILLIYQGNLSYGRGLNLLIEAISKTKKEIKLIILGDGAIKNELLDLVTNLSLFEKVKFIGKTKVENIHEYTKGANYGINFLEDFNLSKQMASPNKLFEYIHANTPIICNNTLENEKVMKEFNLGYCINLNLTEIINTLNSLNNNTSFDTNKFELAKEKYCWQVEERKLEMLNEQF